MAKPVQFRSWLFWALIGLLILYFTYAAIDEKIALQKYETIFATAQHPKGTILLDPIGFSISFYPATYVDDSVRFESACLVGELRQYTGKWADVESFYHENNTLSDDTPLVALPLEIDQRNQKMWLAIMDEVSYSPFDAEVQGALRDHYGARGIPENLNGTEPNLYLVYSSWTGHEEPSR